MKILLTSAVLLMMVSCELERDNPLDGLVQMSFERIELIADSNQDGEISNGETILLKVVLKNTGISIVSDVKTSISTTSVYINSLSPIGAIGYYEDGSSYGDHVDIDEEAYPSTSSDYLLFTLANDTPIGTEIQFDLLITDADNNQWQDEFSITVLATTAVMTLERVTLYDDSDGNNQVNAGETVQLRPYLKNVGLGNANKVKALISTSNSYISKMSPINSVSFAWLGSTSYSYIEPDEEAYPLSIGDYLKFDISDQTPFGTTVEFDVLISDEYNNQWTDKFSIIIY